MRPPANNALARLGTLSVTLNDELRPGWLVADGTTEYARVTSGVSASKAGKPTATIEKIPITPKSIGVNVFVFAGLPQV
jgi:hypothetical protein